MIYYNAFLVIIFCSFVRTLTQQQSCAGYSGSKYSHCLPDEEYGPYQQYIEKMCIPSYRFASDESYAMFNDLKYGVRIHWGIYSIVDTMGGPEAGSESWPFLGYNMTYRGIYQNLYKTWNPQQFDANEWMKFFTRVGFRMFAFTTKHHEGFSMFNTSTKVVRCIDWPNNEIITCNHSYSIMETPFARDVVAEIVTAGRLWNLTVDLYFSHPDWYDADFSPYGYHPLQVPSSCILLDTYVPGQLSECDDALQRLGNNVVYGPDPDEESVKRLVARHRTQLREIVENYKPDMLSLDIQLGGALWSSLRETILEIRKIHPNLLLRDRGIGNYGDYYTPERFVPGDKSNSDVPWFVIYPLGNAFSYDPNPNNYKGPAWVIENLIDSVAKGGNFMVGIGPDVNGNFHPVAVGQLEEVGKWMSVNSEGIFGTQARVGTNWSEGKNIYFTVSKDSLYIYVFSLVWPGTELSLKTVLGVPGYTTVKMLGVPDEDFLWKNTDSELVIEIPAKYQDPALRPCNYVWCWKIEGGQDNIIEM